MNGSIPFLGPSTNRAKNACAVLALAGVGFALFLPHWLGKGIFLGDSDRINTLLNIKGFAVDSIRHHGRVSCWSEGQFTGGPMSGLHWMLPELDPFAYLQAWLPTGSLFRVCGYVSSFFLVCAGWAFYALARAFELRAFPGFVAATLYMMGSFALNRIAQVDWAFAVLIASPLGLAVLKQIEVNNWMRSFLLLIGVFGFLIVFTFLQEVAYVFLLFGAFACYQSYREKNWAPAVLFAAAFGVACVLGLPRLITVAEDFQQISRGKIMQTTQSCEILRWFDDGIFGRFPAEAYAVENNINLHEGFQFYTSTFAALLVIVGAMQFGTWPRTLARLSMFGLLTLVLWEIVQEAKQPNLAWPLLAAFAGVAVATEKTRLLSAAMMMALVPGVLLIATTSSGRMLCCYFCLLALGLVWKKPDLPGKTFTSRDYAFFYVVVCACMAVVLIPIARAAIHELFFGVDFTHSRITIAALVPLNLLVAYWLQSMTEGTGVAGLSAARNRAAVTLRLSKRWVRVLLFCGVILGTATFWGPRAISKALSLDRLIWLHYVRQLPDDVASPEIMHMFPRALIHIALACAGFGVIILASRLGDRWTTRAAAYGFGLLLTAHCFHHAFFQINGAHTWNFPHPFRTNSYAMAPPGAFRDPTAKQIMAVRELLEDDRYRTVFVASPDKFSSFVDPHMAEFWHLRVLGGYCPGVPTRLQGLPWASHVREMRSLAFTNEGMLDWQLLGYLNTKYAVLLDSNFYANVHMVNGVAVPGCEIDKIKILTNPTKVVPRVFFAHRVKPEKPYSKFAEYRSPNLAVKPSEVSIADGFEEERTFSASGTAHGVFRGDRVEITVDKAKADRFLVLNELYHPHWRACCDGRETRIYATNVCMRGLVVPAGATQVKLEFVPFSHTPAALATVIFGLGLSVVGSLVIRKLSKHVLVRNGSAA